MHELAEDGGVEGLQYKHLAVNFMPHSGGTEALMDKAGIGADGIAEAVRRSALKYGRDLVKKAASGLRDRAPLFYRGGEPGRLLAQGVRAIRKQQLLGGCDERSTTENERIGAGALGR